MTYTIFTATGCTRCKIVKSFMAEQGLTYVEKDMKADGKDDFQKFYTANRKRIYRGPDGIEFPIVTDGTEIRQGIGAAIAYLYAGSNLDGYVSVGRLHKEWVDGLHVSEGNPQYAADFLYLLRYLVANNMKLQVTTSGLNAKLLEQILAEKLATVVIMEVKGPRILYGEQFADVEKSLTLVTKFPEYRFETTVAPIITNNGDGEFAYMSTQAIAETAQMIKEVTGSNKQPYLLKLYRAGGAHDEKLQGLEPMPVSKLLSYRTAARAFQVFTDVEKE